MCVVCFRVRCRRTLEAEGRRTTSAARFRKDAARTYQGAARREAFERGLRAEGTLSEWLDLEVGQGLADERRHGSFAFYLTNTERRQVGQVGWRESRRSSLALSTLRKAY